LSRAGLIIEQEGRTRLGDEFRIAGSRVNATMNVSIGGDERGCNLLLITSTRPGEGKSFTALNLAAGLAQMTERPVILTDIDSKPGCLSDLVGLRRARGMFNLVQDSAISPKDLIVPTEVAGLFILPLGIPDTYAGVTGRERPLAVTVEAVAHAMPEATFVLDTGPLLSTSDPSVLAPSVAQIVMVVEAERTQRAELDAALELIRDSRRILLLLNKVSARARSTFGAYSYYGDYYAKPVIPPPPPVVPPDS
jgi:receptor protein-tyrosine kinase